MRPRILIAGLGNLLLTDDGFGVHAERLLAQRNWDENVRLLEVGTCALHVQHEFEEADVVIALDAVQTGREPAAMCVFGLDRSALEENAFTSLHDLGIAGVLRLMDPRRRPTVLVVGVEPKVLDYGVELSPAVQAQLPAAAKIVRRLVDRIQECGPLDPAALYPTLKQELSPNQGVQS